MQPDPLQNERVFSLCRVYALFCCCCVLGFLSMSKRMLLCVCATIPSVGRPDTSAMGSALAAQRKVSSTEMSEQRECTLRERKRGAQKKMRVTARESHARVRTTSSARAQMIHANESTTERKIKMSQVQLREKTKRKRGARQGRVCALRTRRRWVQDVRRRRAGIRERQTRGGKVRESRQE